MIRCPKCNKEMPENSKFCKSCGARLLTNDENKKSKKKIVISVVAVSVAVVIALSGFLIFNKMNDKSDLTEKNSEKQTVKNDVTKPNVNNQEEIYETPDEKYYILAKTKISVDSDNQSYSYTWSENSLEAEPVEPGPAKTLYEFNDKGQVIKCSSGSLESTTGEWDPYPYHYEYIYNGGLLEKIVSVQDGTARNQKTVKYDSNNNMTELTGYDEAGEVYSVETYEYDSRNRLTKVIIYDAEFIFTYEDNNVVTIEVVPYYDTLHGYGTITLEYNEYGKLEKYYYDFESSEINEEVTYVCSYDENQNLVKIECTYVSAEVGTRQEIYEFEWKEGTEAQAKFSDLLIREHVGDCGAGFASYHYPIDYSPIFY